MEEKELSFPSTLLIQPNYKAFSEVWMERIMAYFDNKVVGLAAYLPHDKKISEKFPVFDLCGRNPDFKERQLMRLGFLKFNRQEIRNKELEKFIKDANPEIILIHFLSTAVDFLSVIKNIRIPIFIHVHGFDIQWDTKGYESNFLNVHPETYLKDAKEIASWPNVHFISNSEFSRNQLKKIGIPESKISLKYYGVDRVVIQRDYYKEKLKVLFLGRFVEFKAPDIVLQAFIEACKRGFKGELIMAGDGPLKLMCQIIAKRSEYGNLISFKGIVSKEVAQELYREADIYSMHNCKGPISGSVETFGATIIEAMTTGLPVITGRSGGPAEIITNEMDGLLVEPGSIDEHANAFLRLFADRELCKKLSANAVQTVENRFSKKQEKNSLLRIFLNHK